MLNTFFGFKGRIGRGSWWLAQLIAIPVVYLFGFTALVGLAGAAPESAEPSGGAMLLVILAAIAVAIWINVASTIKRYHDRGKSGAWFFIVFVPLIGGFWQLIECGFCRGDEGENAYGLPGGTGDSDIAGTPAEGGRLANLDDEYFRAYAAQSQSPASRMAEPIVQSTYNRPAGTVTTPSGFGGKPSFGRR